jgi:hypothetical protein
MGDFSDSIALIYKVLSKNSIDHNSLLLLSHLERFAEIDFIVK